MQARRSLEAQRIPCEGHGEGLNGNWLKIEDPGVQVDGTESSGCDDDTLELAEHRLHRQAGIQTAQLHYKALLANA